VSVNAARTKKISKALGTFCRQYLAKIVCLQLTSESVETQFCVTSAASGSEFHPHRTTVDDSCDHGPPIFLEGQSYYGKMFSIFRVCKARWKDQCSQCL